MRALATRPPRSTAFIERYRADQRAAGRDDRVQWIWVAYPAISTDIKRAVLVAEDIRLLRSRRVRPRRGGGRIRARRRAEGAARGASTITQQLAKNLWLTPSRSPSARCGKRSSRGRSSSTLTKRRILELYLNVAEFGPGCYGVEAAARRYFGKSAADVGSAEAAQLAASLPNPRLWHPGSTSRAYQSYVTRIARRVERADWLGRLL